MHRQEDSHEDQVSFRTFFYISQIINFLKIICFPWSALFFKGNRKRARTWSFIECTSIACKRVDTLKSFHPSILDIPLEITWSDFISKKLTNSKSHLRLLLYFELPSHKTSLVLPFIFIKSSKMNISFSIMLSFTFNITIFIPKSGSRRMYLIILLILIIFLSCARSSMFKTMSQI